MRQPPTRVRSVVVEREGAVVTLVLSHPERRNPLSSETMAELTGRLREAGADRSVRAVVIGSTGPAFCAGHDLRELSTRDPQVHERVFAACAELMLAVHRLPQPVIARVQGIATAAGCQLVAACDLAVAAEGARFATPGVRIGLFCTTPMVEVARAVGRSRATEMLLTGEAIDAATALAWGLVNRVVPAGGLEAEARALARRVASASRGAVAIGKRAMRENLDLPLEEAYRHASAVMCRNAATDDAQEGIAAFLDKREPVWSHSE
jgi:enoyl-CoA hydratase/carnithine racemase